MWMNALHTILDGGFLPEATDMQRRVFPMKNQTEISEYGTLNHQSTFLMESEIILYQLRSLVSLLLLYTTNGM